MSTTWAELAALERDCYLWQTAWHGFGTATNAQCQSCNGSGKVAMLPGLRVPCYPLTGPRIAHQPKYHDGALCPGWQPAPRSLETLMVALREAGYKPHVAWLDLLDGDNGMAVIGGGWTAAVDSVYDAETEFYSSPLAALGEATIAASAALKAS